MGRKAAEEAKPEESTEQAKAEFAAKQKATISELRDLAQGLKDSVLEQFRPVIDRLESDLDEFVGESPSE